MQTQIRPAISSTFIWRRVHSLMGFWLVIYLSLHLFTNSQAALWFGSDGSAFVRMVNFLETLPYLHFVEVLLIGIPLAIHMVWGVYRALTARPNVGTSGGTKPSLKYERNVAYTLQRLSSWILLVGIVGHVIQMRFVDMPTRIARGGEELSVVKITTDDRLAPLAQRLGVTLLTQTEIDPDVYPSFAASYFRSNEVIAVAPNPGKAILLMVRNTFKSPWMACLYTIFVLAAAFHAFNGFWTFLVAWGVILSYRSQRSMIPLCLILAAGLAFLGLAAIWASYLLGN